MFIHSLLFAPAIFILALYQNYDGMIEWLGKQNLFWRRVIILSIPNYLNMGCVLIDLFPFNIKYDTSHILLSIQEIYDYGQKNG